MRAFAASLQIAATPDGLNKYRFASTMHHPPAHDSV
jgi:hypothetical protein